MKARLILLLVTIALVSLALWSISHRGMLKSRVTRSPVAAKTPALAVPIQDGKTLDFSSGKAVVKDSAADRTAIDRSVTEMNAAAGNVTFAPKATATPTNTLP
jgi:hypothetical protein